MDPVPGDAVLVHPYAKGSWVLRKPMGCCLTGHVTRPGGPTRKDIQSERPVRAMEQASGPAGW